MMAPVIIKLALTKSVGNRFPVTKRTPWTKPINNQVIIEQKSLSVLLFQQFLLFLCQPNQFGISWMKMQLRFFKDHKSIFKKEVEFNFRNTSSSQISQPLPYELSQLQEACLSSAFSPQKSLFCFYLRKASPV